MLGFTVPVTETTTHIVDPIVQQMVYSFLDQIGCRGIFGDDIRFITDYTNASGMSDGTLNPKTVKNSLRCEVEMSQDPAEIKMGGTTHSDFSYQGQTYQLSNFPVFADTKNRIYVYEHSAPTHVQLNLTAKFKTREEAYKFPSRVQQHYGRETYFSVDMMYDYPFPSAFIVALFHLYKMKRDETRTFGEYIRECGQGFVGTRKGRHSEDTEVVIKKMNTKMGAKITSRSERVEAQKVEKYTNAYTYNCVLEFQFSRPVDMLINYPIIVDNSLVPSTLIPDRSWGTYTYIDEFSMDRAVESVSRPTYRMDEPSPLRVPLYDRWQIPSNSGLSVGSYRPFMIQAFLLDENDSGEIMETTKVDLGSSFRISADSDAPAFTLSEDVKSYIRKNGRKCFTLNSKIYITIFADNTQIEPGILDIDEDLNVIVPITDYSRVYRVVVSEDRRSHGYFKSWGLCRVDFIAKRTN